MDKETIERAAVDSCVINRSIYNPELTPYYKQGFIDGVHWLAGYLHYLPLDEAVACLASFIDEEEQRDNS